MVRLSGEWFRASLITCSGKRNYLCFIREYPSALAILGFLKVSKVVTSSSVSATSSISLGRDSSARAITPAFSIPPVECIPKQLGGIVENLVTTQVRKIVGAHQSKGDLGSGCVIIISSKGVVQIFRRNADGAIGQLIVEAAAYSDNEDS